MKNNCESISILLSGYLDNELTQQESQKVQLHLEQCEDCMQIYKQIKSTKESLGQMPDPVINEREMEMLNNQPLAKFFRWSGALLVSICLAILIGFSAYIFWFEDETATWLKIVVSSFYGGFALLFLSVLIQRIKSYKNDRYKGVDL